MPDPAGGLPGRRPPIVIDGYTQPGASSNTLANGNDATLLIELDGSNAGAADGLSITANDTTIQGLVINRFSGDGVEIKDASNNLVQGNFIGIDTTGALDLGNTQMGVRINGGSGNTIGGATPAARNVVSGNDSHGIIIQNGLILNGSNNLVRGNFIGTDVNGTAALGNSGNGVLTNFASNNTIGGAVTGAANVISGNVSGIAIQGANNVVQGNFIGTDLTGVLNIGNVEDGIFVTGSNTTIGGAATGAGNTIAFNGEIGIQVSSSTATSNAILSNSIFANAQLGIDLGFADGVTANDAGDADTGPNNLQNFPDLTSAVSVSASTTIDGQLNSTPNTEFTIEFFSNAAALGTPEGEVLLGATTVTTGATGDVSYSVSFPVTIAADDLVTATATDPGGNTSEFSASVVVVTNRPPTADAGGPYSQPEGTSFQLDATDTNDPDEGNGSLSFEWDLDYDGVTFDVDTTGEQPTVSFPDNFAPRNIAVRVTDSGGLTDIATTTLEIGNVDPTISAISTDATFADKADENEQVTLSVNFADAGTADTHSATIDWGDGTTSSGAVNQTNGTVSSSHAYSAGGVYTVALTLTDDDNGQVTAVTTAVVIGVGVNDGVLQVIGTSAADNVTINLQNGPEFKVHADFLPENFRTFDAVGVTEILVVLCEGDDHATVSGAIVVPAQLEGGEGDDKLKGGDGDDILLGGPGDDVLVGQSGRDLLIGGEGGDRIVGNAHDDILIAGTTAHDDNHAALAAIMAEWTSSNSYDDRVNNLRSVLLIADGPDATVFDDGVKDTLTGSSGIDWFFANLDGGVEDKITDLDDDEFADVLDWILAP